jgi:hypothetical protein
MGNDSRAARQLRHAISSNRDDLRTRSEAASAVFRREEGAEQPESVARTAQMITHPPRGKLGVCAGKGVAQSPRGAAASNARQVAVATSRCPVSRTDLECNLHRTMIPIRPMNGGLTDTPVSLPLSAFPLLEAIFPPGSSDSEKAECLFRLFKMALQPEDDL